MESLHNISLSSNTKSLSLYKSNENTMKQFLNTKCFDFNNVEILRFSQFYGEESAESYTQTFCNLLRHFENLKFLELSAFSDIELMHIFDDETFRNNIFNHLEGLSFYGSDVNFHNHLLHYFSDILVSFHFTAAIKPPRNGFSKLKELCVVVKSEFISPFSFCARNK